MANRVVNFFINGFNAVKIRNKQDLKNIYRGNVPLVYTFWIFPLYLLPVNIAMKYFEFKYEGVPYEQLTAQTVFLILSLLTIYTAFTIFSCIASWRSAKKYSGRRLWKWLAKFTVILIAVVVVGSFLMNFAIVLSDQTKVLSIANDNYSSTINNSIEAIH